MGKKDKEPKGGKAGGKAGKGGNDDGSGRLVQQLSKHQRKKAGGDAYKKNWVAFNEQLRGIGLCLRTIGSDGNCLFRSLADQLCGAQDEHMRFRGAVVDYMASHPLDFAPFVWDCTFAEYCAKMRKSGEWGGAAELAAASKCFGCNITVHQYGAPRLENIYDPASVTFDPHTPSDPPLPVTRDTKTIHVSYHEAEHYSSVRNIADAHSFEPATPIVISDVACAASSSSSSSSSSGPALTQQETIVLQSGSGCKNLSKIRRMLAESWNDANVVVETLFAEQALGLDTDIDHDELERMQQREIEAQRKEQQNKEAALRVKELERIEREKITQMQLQKIERERAERAEQKQKRDADTAAPAPASMGEGEEEEERKGEPPEPASDDQAESDSEEQLHDGDDGDEQHDAAGAPSAAAASASSSSSSSSAAAASSSSSSSAPAPSLTLRPPISSLLPPKKALSGREKRQAQKQSKMLKEKLKRDNKAVIKKERIQTGAKQPVEASPSIVSMMGSVRI